MFTGKKRKKLFADILIYRDAKTINREENVPNHPAVWKSNARSEVDNEPQMSIDPRAPLALVPTRTHRSEAVACLCSPPALTGAE